MIKLKKVIPIFMFIFSIFLIGNNKVKAYESTININKSVSEYTEKFNSINGKYSNVNDNIKYFLQNSGWQKYGKYIFIDYDEKDMYAYVTDDYENFNIVGYFEAYTGKNRFTYNFGNSKSKCSLFIRYSQTSPYNTYESFILDTGKFEFEENRKNTGIITNMPSVKLYSSIVNFTDKTFNPGDVFFSGNSTYDTVIGENTPTLNYKNSFISNEDYDKLGKVSIEFSENDENISKYNYAQFKLQYGSNDFKQENIPIFSHYKVFGKANANTNWEEVDPKSISYNDEQMNLQVIDTSYDYVEGSLADSTVTVQMDFMKSLNSLYEIWKIEFYFDNTQNGYFYVADTLKNSKWTDTSKFLENYIYYEFPNDKMYAFISSENENNSGKIYFPTNSIENEEVKINFKYFDRKSNTYDSPLPTKIYNNDDYYSYIDFKFNNKEKILSVNRNKGSHVVKTYGTDILNFYKSWFGLNKNIIPNEITYFYVPIGFNVYFSNGKDITQVKTSEGYVDIDNSTTTDYFNSSNVSDSISDLLKNISLEKNNKLISLINELYNKFRQSQIGGYVYMIIITSIIILVIKAIKR